MLLLNKKMVILSLLAIGLNICSAQILEKKTLSLWEKLGNAIERNIEISGDRKIDSCYYSMTFIKIEINKRSKIVDICLSDNADFWIKDQINIMRNKNDINILQLDSIAKKERIKNVKIIFPLIIYSWDYPCLKPEKGYDEKLFIFNGIKISGNVVLSKEMGIKGYRYLGK